MQIQVEIDISTSNYGTTVAHTELILDSDHVNKESVAEIVTGMVKSALERAEEAAKPKLEPEVVTPEAA